MSTRSNIQFYQGSTLEANIYRHSDGYPEVGGADIARFLDRMASFNNTRFEDAEYLAARFVVFLAQMSAYKYENRGDGYRRYPAEDPLDFISVGVCIENHGDIEYLYKVRCGFGRVKPGVEVFEIGTGGREIRLPFDLAVLRKLAKKADADAAA